nr:uncharacterized protein LOC106686571 [Halyomorpha halys]
MSRNCERQSTKIDLAIDLLADPGYYKIYVLYLRIYSKARISFKEECLEKGKIKIHVLRIKTETDCFIHVIWKSNLACFSEKPSQISSNIAVWCFFSVAILVLAVIVVAVLRFNRQLNLGSCLNRTLGYTRSEDTELKSLTIEEGNEEEALFILKTR